MPFWYVISLALTVALAVAHRHHPGLRALIAGAVLFVVSIVMSVAVLVPLNNRAKHWTPHQVPDDWREQQARWDRYHYLRVAVIVAAFALVAIGAVRGA